MFHPGCYSSTCPGARFHAVWLRGPGHQDLESRTRPRGVNCGPRLSLSLLRTRCCPARLGSVLIFINEGLGFTNRQGTRLC